MIRNRRWFLQGSVFSGAALLAGCDDETVAPAPNDGAGGGGGEGGAPPEMCDDPLAGGELLGELSFTEPVAAPLNQKIGSELEGRLFTDITDLTNDTLVTPNDIFYIRTGASNLLDTTNWTIQLSGLVAAPVTLTIDDLAPLVEPQGVHLLECSGNYDGGGFGLISAADWAGVPLSKILAMAEVQPGATRVLISGFDEYSSISPNSISTPGASWIYTLAELESAFLATEMNGVPLPLDHGFPVRLLNPGWFGCCNIKWLNEIIFVDDSEPSTEHMKEFAERTLQIGIPALAKDFIPATIDQTAVPVRIEKWLLDGDIVYRVVGILWGGYALTDKLVIQFNDEPWQPVTVCPSQATNATWTLWDYVWRPSATGSYTISMHIDDPAVPQRRLDTGRYLRAVVIDEVSA